ncbi:MAG: hypothetical protein ACNA8W_05310 [Bradymonadaceae bacterium]
MKTKKNTYWRWMGGWTAIAAASSIFCGAPIDGQQGNLRFDFMQETHPTGLVPGLSMAVGSALDFTVDSLDGDEISAIASTNASNKEAFSAGAEGKVLTLSAAEEGDTKIEVTVTLADGDTVADDFSMSAYHAKELALSHACANITAGAGGDDVTATYLVDSDIWMQYFLYADDSLLLKGYGYHPLEIEGEAELDLDRSSRDLAYLRIQAGSEPGEASLNPTLAGDSLNVRLARAEAIEGAAVIENISQFTDDRPRFGHIVPVIDGKPVCFADVERTLENLTPEICEVEAAPDSDLSVQPQARVMLTRKSEGDCRFRVSYPAGNQGSGASTIFSVDANVSVLEEE